MRKAAFIAIAIMTACLGWRGSGDAEKNAREYVDKHIKNEVSSIDCVGGTRADSDGDGYVSCTLFFNDARPPLGIECSTGIGCMAQKGCRVATGKSRRQ